jgi:RNA polymerase sigma-70 factor, ECF subfamily
VKEAAAKLGVTVGYAKVLQHRALRQAAVEAERMEP